MCLHFLLHVQNRSFMGITGQIEVVRPSVKPDLYYEKIAATCDTRHVAATCDSDGRFYIRGRSTYRVHCTGMHTLYSGDSLYRSSRRLSILDNFLSLFGGIGWTTLSEDWYDHGRTCRTGCDTPLTLLLLLLLLYHGVLSASCVGL